MLTTVLELPAFIFEVVDCAIDLIALLLIAVQYLRKGDDVL